MKGSCNTHSNELVIERTCDEGECETMQVNSIKRQQGTWWIVLVPLHSLEMHTSYNYQPGAQVSDNSVRICLLNSFLSRDNLMNALERPMSVLTSVMRRTDLTS